MHGVASSGSEDATRVEGAIFIAVGSMVVHAMYIYVYVHTDTLVLI